MDYSKDLVWLLFDMSGGPFPPYLLEIVMVDGRSFFIYSPNSRDEESKSLVLDVYDLRAIGPDEENVIKEQLEKGNWSDSSRAEDLHPLLTFSRLRCNLDDISYCIEWLRHRRWTLADFVDKEEAKKIGFQLPNET